MEFISQPWAWYVAGPLIAIILLLVNYFGRGFGVSTNLETFCTIGGAGKVSDYFKKDWKEQAWGLLFLVGIIIGGYISSQYLMPVEGIALNPETVSELSVIGFDNAGGSYLPAEIYAIENIFKRLCHFNRWRIFNWIWIALRRRLYIWTCNYWFK